MAEYHDDMERLKGDISATKKLNRKLQLRVQTFEKKLELQQVKEQRVTTMLDKANEEVEKYKQEQEAYSTLVNRIFFVLSFQLIKICQD